MVIGERSEEMSLHPFDKIEKQRMIGDPGDLIMYLKVALAGPAALEMMHAESHARHDQGVSFSQTDITASMRKP